MKVSWKSIVVFFLAVLPIVVLAQTEKKYIKAAEEAIEQENKDLALQNYLKAQELNPENAQTNFEIGRLYLETTYRTRSLPYLQKAYQLNPEINPKINLMLGMSLHLNNKFDEAIEQFEKARQALKKDKDAEAIMKAIDRYIYECNNGKEFVANPVDVVIENMGPTVNTQYREYAPIVSADEKVMILTTRNPNNSEGQKDEEGQYFEDIYITHKIGDQWTTPKHISLNVNSIEHDASVGLSPEGDEMFIYKVDGGGDIYYCRLNEDGTWTKPKPVEGEVNSKYYENSITISSNEKRMFFTSNRPVDGASGDLDIYECDLMPNGKWGKPRNLGPKINSPYPEEAVFLDFDDHTLYFSSRGHKGMGGYDIFKTVYDSTSKEWTEPVNLGYPINTADDDIFFTVSGDGRYAYYSSVRDHQGQGDDDIYRITMPPREDYHLLIKKLQALKKVTYETAPEPEPQPEPEPVVVAPQKQPVLLKGQVTDQATGAPLMASVKLSGPDGSVMKQVTTGADGMYSFDVSSDESRQLGLYVEKEGYGYATGESNIPAMTTEKQEIISNFTLKKPEVGQVFILRNIYYDFDKATLRKESVAELQKLKKFLIDNPQLKVRINSHTDNKGSNEYNIALSKRRAQSVVSWLVQNGIPKDRLQSEGFGEEKPIASNDDETEGRELNRRTEFEIIGQ